jgi:hypothetical protein
MASGDQRQKNVTAIQDMLGFLKAKPGTELAPLKDTYSLAKASPERGRWYFVATCSSCKRDTPLFEDTTGGSVGNPFTGSGGFRVPCYHCGKEVRASPGDVQPVLWQL